MTGSVAHYALGALGLLFLTYALVRVGAVAYHRTKLEYLEKVKQGEEKDGTKD
jgi:hypothetical protein